MQFLNSSKQIKMCKKSFSLIEINLILISFSSHNVPRIEERLEAVTQNLNSFGRIVDKQEKLIHVKQNKT